MGIITANLSRETKGMDLIFFYCYWVFILSFVFKVVCIVLSDTLRMMVEAKGAHW